MKRTIFLIIALLLIMLLLCTCTEGGLNAKAGIDEALTGIWYGSSNNPVLNINTDGTGTVTYNNIEYAGAYSTDNNVYPKANQVGLCSA